MLFPAVSTLKVTASPTTRSDNWPSPFLSMSLLPETAYMVVPDDVLIVTLAEPTAVTVPDRSRPRPYRPP